MRTKSRNEVAAELRKKYKNTKPKSWNRVADEYGLSKGTVYGIAMNGRDPHDQRIRKILGMGQQVCSTCNRKLAPPRKAIKRSELSAEMGWWRNELSSSERQSFIHSLYRQYHNLRKEA